MERLTIYDEQKNAEMICRYEDCDTGEEYCPDLNEDNCSCLQEVLEKLAEYEDLGLEPNEIKPYIELAEKMNVCDLVRENKRLSDKIRFLEAQKKQI